MPYSSIDELPDSVSDIPKHAKEIFLSAYNSAADSTCKDRGDQKEQCAMSIAWSAVKTKYKKNDDGKWVETKEESKSTIKSVITDRPVIDNGTWIPFLKPGQIAEGSDGKRYRITKEAIEKGYESYKDGFVNVNHQDHISGKISDVKYDGTFAYAKLDGLTPEALDVINSVAYRGVSQESFNLKAAPGTDEMTDVLELKGNGLAIALYPKKPGCPIESGCGIPTQTASIVSELDSELYIKLVSATGCKDPDLPKSAYLWVEDPEKKTTWHLPYRDLDGNIDCDCLRAAIAAIGGARSGKPMDVPASVITEIKKHAKGCGIELGSSVTNFSLNTHEKTRHDIDIGGKRSKMTDQEDKSTTVEKPVTQVDSTVSDEILSTISAQKQQIENLMKENLELKSTVKKMNDDFPTMLKSALEAHDAQLKLNQEMEQLKKSLYSVAASKEAADKMLATNPNLEMLKSTIEALTELKDTSQKPMVGAATGQIHSTILPDDHGLTVGGTVMVERS